MASGTIISLPSDPADPGALHCRADAAYPEGAAPARRQAGAGPVRELRHPARAGPRTP